MPWSLAVLAALSSSCPPPEGRLPTCYSPVRHSTHSRRSFRVRLACVKPAANVRSEPGSNSPVENCERLVPIPIDSCTRERALEPEDFDDHRGSSPFGYTHEIAGLRSEHRPPATAEAAAHRQTQSGANSLYLLGPAILFDSRKSSDSVFRDRLCSALGPRGSFGAHQNGCGQ